MKTLQNILTGVDYIKIIHDNPSAQIKDIAFDSRKVNADCLFVAEKGELTDGHLYIDKAIQSGAKAIVLEDESYIDNNSSVTYIIVKSSSFALAQISRNFFDNPSAKLNLIGVTGTNGKTTTVTLLYELFTRLGYKCGKISTVENIIVDKVLPTQ